MKNLKKALVLVLAFAMVFGMFTIGASAATSFNDDEDIVNKEAVATMTQLGIINGYDDGTFAPKRIVTRAEMCKMIATALNGGTAPIFDANTVVFSDTKGHWANAYINFCFTKGIISGDSGRGGAFRPDATVTALEAAKMMLVALGYNATIAGFTGPDWANNVAMAANEKGLFAGLGALNVSAGLTRDSAAQLIYNGLDADMVEYSSTLATDADGKLVTVPVIKSANTTILKSKFGVKKVVGVLVANDTFALGSVSSKDSIDVFVRSIDGDTGATGVGKKVTYKVDASADLLGQEVAFFVKTSGSDTKVIGGVYPTTNNKVLTTYAALTNASVTTNGSLLKFAKDNGLTFETTAVSAPTSTEFTADATSYYIDNVFQSGTAITSNGNGVKLILIDNDNDGKVEVAMQVNSTLTRVVAYNASAKNLTLATAGVISFDDAFGYEYLAKNDYVNYTKLNGKYTFYKAESVTGKVTAYTDTKSFTVGGVVYKPSDTNLEAALTKVTTTANSISALGFSNTYTFYLDLAGNPVAYKIAEAGDTASNYAVVLNSGVSSTKDALTGADSYTGTVKILLADGTVATYTVDMLESYKKFAADGIYNTELIASGVARGFKKLDATGNETEAEMDSLSDLNTDAKKIAAFAGIISNPSNSVYGTDYGDKLADKFVTYTINDGKIVLAPTAQFTGGTVVKNQVTLGAKVMNSTTTFLYFGNNKGAAITGIAKLSTTPQAVTTYVADTNGVVKFVYIKAAPVTTAAGNYAYITSDVSVISENNKTYNTYQAVTATGELVTLKLETGVLTKNAVYTYEIDSNNVVTNPVLCDLNTGDITTANKTFTGYVSAINGEVVTLTAADGKTASFIATDLKVWNITGSTPFAGELSEYNQVTIVIDDSTPVKIVAAYVTKTTATSYAVKVGTTTIGYYYAGQTVELTATQVPSTSYKVTCNDAINTDWNGQAWVPAGGATTFTGGTAVTFTMPAAEVTLQ